MIFLLSLFGFWRGAAFAQALRLDDDYGLLMAVEFFDGALVSENTTMYHIGTKWYLPLGELADGMDVAIRVSTTQQRAEGFVVDERRTIILDPPTCKLVKSGKEESFNCDLATILNDELFVEAALFSRIMDVDLQFNLNKSLVVINTQFKFPVQLKADRERSLRKGVGTNSNQPPPDFRLLADPSVGLGGPAIDQQIGLNVLGRDGQFGSDSETTLRHDTFLGAELLGLNSRFFVGGENTQISEQLVNISKKDVDGNLLGSLKAREVQAIDYSFPSVQMLSLGGRVSGLLVSNFPLNLTSDFTSQEFRGPLPSGWEVELYQNDVLIDRVIASAATEYEFKNLPLLYGLNRFTLVFYGPQGQRREEIRVINVDPSSIRPKESHYRFAVGQKNKSERQVALMQYSLGLAPQWSVNTAYFRGAPRDHQEDLNYGLVGIIGGLGRYLMGLDLTANDDSDNGKAAELSLQAPFDHFNVGLSYTLLDNFRSEQFNADSGVTDQVVEAASARANFGLPALLGLQLSFDANKKIRESHKEEVTGVQRTSWALGRTYWFNTLNYDQEASPTTTGELATLFDIKDFDFRAAVEYKKEVTAAGLSAKYIMSKTETSNINYRKSIETQISDVAVGFSKAFRHYTVNTDVSFDTDGNWSAFLSLAYGAILNHHRKVVHLSPQAISDTGMLDVTVYLDLNQNGELEQGEPLLPDIGLQVNFQDVPGTTDQFGRLMIASLPTYQLIGLSVSLKTLTDPMHRPLERGHKMVLRPARVMKINIPVGIFSEVTGIVQIRRAGELVPAKSLELQLNGVTNKFQGVTQSESDGFYVFDGIPPGAYTLRIKPEGLSELGVSSQPESVPIVIPERGLDSGSFDFILE